MSDEEKVQAYNHILQKYLEYQRTDRKIVEPATVNQKIPYFDVESDVMRTIPKTMKRKAEALLERIKAHPDTSWNERGEFIYRGRVVEGSNVVDLLNDILRQRKGFEPHGRFEFSRALRQTNVPQDMVGNRPMWNWMHRESATSDAFSTADEHLTDNEDTSPRRSRDMVKTPARKRLRKEKIKVKHKINWLTPK